MTFFVRIRLLLNNLDLQHLSHTVYVIPLDNFKVGLEACSSMKRCTRYWLCRYFLTEMKAAVKTETEDLSCPDQLQHFSSFFQESLLEPPKTDPFSILELSGLFAGLVSARNRFKSWLLNF